MRSSDLVAVAVLGIAGLVIVQATWTPPTITPSQAHEHIGQRVRVTGVLVDVQWYDSGGRGDIVADGGLLHVRFLERHPLPTGTLVHLEGLLDREQGLPLLVAQDVETRQAEPTDALSLAAVARETAALDNRIITVRGDVEGRQLLAEGHAIRLAGHLPPDGPATVTGAFVYQASCLCHRISVTTWTH